MAKIKLTVAEQAELRKVVEASTLDAVAEKLEVSAQTVARLMVGMEGHKSTLTVVRMKLAMLKGAA